MFFFRIEFQVFLCFPPRCPSIKISTIRFHLPFSSQKIISIHVSFLLFFRSDNFLFVANPILQSHQCENEFYLKWNEKKTNKHTSCCRILFQIEGVQNTHGANRIYFSRFYLWYVFEWSSVLEIKSNLNTVFFCCVHCVRFLFLFSHWILQIKSLLLLFCWLYWSHV